MQERHFHVCSDINAVRGVSADRIANSRRHRLPRSLCVIAGFVPTPGQSQNRLGINARQSQTGGQGLGANARQSQKVDVLLLQETIIGQLAFAVEFEDGGDKQKEFNDGLKCNLEQLAAMMSISQTPPPPAPLPPTPTQPQPPPQPPPPRPKPPPGRPLRPRQQPEPEPSLAPGPSASASSRGQLLSVLMCSWNLGVPDPRCHMGQTKKDRREELPDWLAGNFEKKLAAMSPDVILLQEVSEHWAGQFVVAMNIQERKGGNFNGATWHHNWALSKKAILAKDFWRG